MELSDFSRQFYINNVGIGAIDWDLSWVEILHLSQLISIKVSLSDASVEGILIEEDGNGSSRLGKQKEVWVSNVDVSKSQGVRVVEGSWSLLFDVNILSSSWIFIAPHNVALSVGSSGCLNSLHSFLCLRNRLHLGVINTLNTLIINHALVNVNVWILDSIYPNIVEGRLINMQNGGCFSCGECRSKGVLV